MSATQFDDAVRACRSGSAVEVADLLSAGLRAAADRATPAYFFAGLVIGLILGLLL